MARLISIKKPIIILTAIILAGAITVAGVSLYRQRTNKVVCSSGLLKRAAEGLEPLNISKLSELADEVEQLGGYDRDQNCMYILVSLALENGNFESAEGLINRLKDIYDPNLGFSNDLGEDVKSLAELEQKLAQVQRQSQSLQQNIMTFPNIE